MHSINKRRPQAVAAILALSLAGSAVAAPLVVRSAGPSAKTYPAGKAIPDDAKIVLKANDMIVLLDGKGTRTLTGPGTFSATASAVAAATTGSTLSALVNSGGERRARIGAVRSVKATDSRNPSVWFVDLDRSSNMCIADPTSVTLWRHDSEAAASVTVTRVSDGAKASLDLAAGQARASWPAALPVADGGQYKLSWVGAKAPTAVKFIVIKAGSPGLEDMAQSLIKAGCDAQLNLLIETVSVPGQPQG